MVKNDYGYALSKEFKTRKGDIYTLDTIEEPRPVYFPKKSMEEEVMYSPNSLSFINTSELTKTARYFEQHGVYTKADPVYDKYAYNRFWDEEEERRRHGMTIPGELYKDDDGVFHLRNIHVTGEHYGYLNYGRINRVPEELLIQDTDSSEEYFDEISQQTQAGAKEVTFPDFWDGDFYYFKAIELARKLGKHLVVGKARRKGYAQPHSEIVMTPEGEVPMGEIKVGDTVLTPKGTAKVLELFPQGKIDVYELTLRDGRKVKCSKEHLWEIIDSRGKKRVVNTEFFLDKKLIRNEGKSNQYYGYAIENTYGVDYEEKEYKIDPYALGILIGDGSLTQDTVLFSSDDTFVVEEMQRIFKDNEVVKTGAKYQYRINGIGRRNWIMQEIRNLKLDTLARKKHIPEIYKRGSYEQRLELLKGLMDSDGSIGKAGACTYVTGSEKLADDVSYLCNGLGIRTYKSKRKGEGFSTNDYWVVIITTDIEIFKLPRKKSRTNTIRKANIHKIPIVKVEKLDYQEESSCILIDSKEHLYLTANYVVTHNSYKNGWICANRADLYPDSVTGITAYDADSLYPKGTFSMADDYLQWIYEHTDWSKRRLRDSKEGFIKFGYKYKSSSSVERGYKSSIIAVPFGPAQPGAMRGKDAALVIVEEAGKARNLADFLESTLPTLKAGRFITGLMIVFGTGGGDDAFWEHFEELFYDPASSDFLLFENLFDKDAEEEGCGFYMPDFANKEGFYDKDGNSMTREAATYEISIRKMLKKKGKIKKLRDRSMEYSFSPSEAFSRSSDNIFPSEIIEQCISNIKRNALKRNLGRSGLLAYNERGNVIFKDARFLEEAELLRFHPEINDLKLKPSKDNHGSFVQFRAPYRDANGNVPDNLYRIWHDPFGIDKDNKDMTSKHSFGCTYVYERVNTFTKGRGGKLVGVYIGRPETTDAYNEILYKIAQYYNGKILYEKNTKGTYDFFRQREALHYLTEEPVSIFDKENEGSMKPNYGIQINDQRKRDGAVYLKDKLLEKVDTDEHGNDILFVHQIPDINLLKELQKWSLKGNFDRVSTLIVGMFDIREQYFVEVEDTMPTTDMESFFNREMF